MMHDMCMMYLTPSPSQVVFEYMWYLAYGFDGRSSPIPTYLEDETDSPNFSEADSQPESTTTTTPPPPPTTTTTEEDPKPESASGKAKENLKPRKGAKLYREGEVDWKMFVPPLPQHR